MTKDKVLAIVGLTKEQKAAAERWFKTPFNKGKEIEGTTAEIKTFLDKRVKEFNHRSELKEKNGSLDAVTELVKSLCKGTRQQRALYTYNQIIDIINQATEEKRNAIDEVKRLEAELKERKEALGIK